ncbi:MAG TPA: hypothetical protein VE439_03315, partial [Anaerolineae bacterium]|nr:hypothetical protein [Anaerolineae bacterium]
ELVLADARNFSLTDTYNAAISTYDSLNHIMSIGELATVFQNVRNVLVEDGLFLFDMNVEEGYLVRWQGDRSVSFVEDDNACIARASYDPEEKVGRSDITMFRLEDEVWRRSDVALFQRAYSEGEVRMALSKAGFSGIAAYDAVKDLGIAGNIGRIFFLAHKY